MKPSHRSAFLRTFLAGSALISLHMGGAHAATLYWDTNGTTAGSGTGTQTGTWGTNTYWSTSSAGTAATTAYVAGSDVVFSAAANATGTNTITVSGAQSANSIAFEDGTITLAGTSTPSLSIGAGGITMASTLAGNVTLGSTLGDIVLTASQSWTNNTVTATGPPATTLRTLTVAAGVVGSATTGNTQTLTIAGASGTGAVTISGIIGNGSGGGTLALTKTGNHMLTIGGASANTYTGATTVSAGTLRLTNAGARGGSTISVASGATLTAMVAGSGFTSAEVTALRSASTLASGSFFGLDTTNGAFSYDTALTGTGVGLAVSGTNALTLGGTAANTYTGTTQISSGTLVLAKTAGTNAIAGNISISGGGLSWTNANQVADTIALSLTGGTANFLGKNETLASITVGGTAGSVGSGSIVSLGNTGGANSTVTLTGALTVSGTGKFNVNSGGTIVANSVTLNGSNGAIGTTDGGNILIGGNSSTGITTLQIGSGGLTMSGQTIQFNTTATAVPANLGGKLVLGGTFNGSGNNTIAYGTAAGNLFSSIDIGAGTRTFAISGGTTSIGVGITGGGINKTGLGTLTLTGSNSYTGGIDVGGGTLVFGNTGSVSGFGNPQPINVASGAVLAVRMGGSGFTNSDITDLISDVTFASGAAFGIDTTTGDLSYSGFNNTTLGFAKVGANTLILTGTNSYTGTTNINEGTLSVSSLGFLGDVPTAGQINLGYGTATGRLRYTGSGESTSRTLNLAGTTGGGVIESSGTGALVLNGNLTATGAGLKTLTLTGSNTGGNIIGGSIANSTLATSLNKIGSGNWTLSGANSYNGSTTIYGGTLTLDYGTSDPIGTGSIITQSGSLVFKGKSTGVTTDTISSLQIGGAVGQFGYVNLVLDSNGGDGVQLTISSLNGTTNTQHHDFIDLSSSTGNSITVGALNNMVVTNGVLMNLTSNSRASLVLRDTDKTYSFATLSNTTSGTLQKLAAGAYTTLTAGNVTLSNANANYLLNKTGTYTTTAASAFTTVTVNTGAVGGADAGAITLALGSNTFNPASGTAGRAVLISGAHDFTISGGASTGIAPNGALWFHNYLDSTATFSLDSNFGSDQGFLVGGTGFTTYSGTGFGNLFVLDGSVFRATTAQLITPILRIGGGGVFEIGADFNGATAGDFSGAVSSTGSGSINFYGDSGLSAYTAVAGGTRVVNFSSGNLTWGTNYFLTNYDASTDGDYALKLSSDRSNATLDIKNNIELNGRLRTVNVADGSASVDAILSGVISGSSGSAAGLLKTGTGTLSLAGNNTYTGPTRVDQGTLLINGNQSGSTGAVTIASGATLGGIGTVGGATSIAGIHSVGDTANSGIGTQTFSSDLTYTSTSTFTWQLGSETTTGAGTNFDSVTIGGALNVEGGIFKIVVNNLNLDSTFWASNQTWDIFESGTGTGNFNSFQLYNASNVSFNYANYGSFSFAAGNGQLSWTVPEPTNALAGVLIAAGMLRRRRNAVG